LRETAPAPPFGLIARARGDAGRITMVLNSFGYYSAEVSITMAGRELDDPDLPNILDQTPQNSSVNVSVAVNKGALYHLRNIMFDGEVPGVGLAAFGLSEGAVANSAEVIAARDRLLMALQEDGYALATVGDPVAYADDAALALDVSFKVDAGRQVDIGAISIEGLQDVNESFVREALSIRTGERYRLSTIEASRQALAATGVFAGVNVRAAEQLSADGRLPLMFDVQERPKRAVNLSGDYSTDLGFSVSVSWLHRNLFGNAEQLNLSAAATGLGGSATGALGYKFAAQFMKPAFRRKDQTLELDLGAIKQNLEAYDQTAETLGAFLRRKLSPQWSGSVGLTATHDDVKQKGTSRLYELLALPLTASYDTTGLTDLLRDPSRGFRASFAVTPTQSFGSRTFTFFTLQASASTYFDLSGTGGTVIAVRGLVGSVLGASNFDLPPDQRLYAGGSATVRGFKYQSIGPQFPNGDPIGGASVDAATLELRQRLFGNFGAAAFIDAGQASADSVPFTGTLRVGAGAGLRYYTAIGVLRADVAVPLTNVVNGDSFEIYIGLGQAF
jgi:translocation and assembly module TamA